MQKSISKQHTANKTMTFQELCKKAYSFCEIEGVSENILRNRKEDFPGFPVSPTVLRYIKAIAEIEEKDEKKIDEIIEAIPLNINSVKKLLNYYGWGIETDYNLRKIK